MSQGTKVVTTIVLVVAFFFVAILLQTGTQVSMTFVALLALGLFLGIRTMWKKDDSDQGPDKPDEIVLDKKRNG